MHPLIIGGALSGAGSLLGGLFGGGDKGRDYPMPQWTPSKELDPAYQSYFDALRNARLKQQGGQFAGQQKRFLEQMGSTGQYGGGAMAGGIGQLARAQMGARTQTEAGIDMSRLQALLQHLEAERQREFGAYGIQAGLSGDISRMREESRLAEPGAMSGIGEMIGSFGSLAPLLMMLKDPTTAGSTLPASLMSSSMSVKNPYMDYLYPRSTL